MATPEDHFNQIVTTPFRLPSPPDSAAPDDVVPRYAMESGGGAEGNFSRAEASAGSGVAAQLNDTTDVQAQIDDIQAQIDGFTITPTCNEDGTLTIEWSFGS